jgi:LacI family transcriptional regulator
VPGDYGLVSYDDHDLFKLMLPSISVVAQPIQLLANESIEALLTIIQEGPSKLIQKQISPSLILRKSV